MTVFDSEYGHKILLQNNLIVFMFVKPAKIAALAVTVRDGIISVITHTCVKTIV